jgi:asparagine synthetase B (glutamine-hydrolysing)
MIGFSSAAWTATVSGGAHPGSSFTLESAEPADVFRDRSGVIVFSGALYNRTELDARHGECASDAERMLRAYRASPDRFPQGVRGVFSFVIHEELSGEVIAGRDRLGIMPLFFAKSRDAIVFSPSFRRLNSKAGISRDPNVVLLAEHLADLWTEPDETYTLSLGRVLPSEVMHFAGEQETRIHYWDPSTGADETDADEVFEKFKHLLSQAVERFMGMGRSGLFLSGGVDSISVAATAREIAQRTGLPRPTGLSLFYRESASNEEAAQTFVAGDLGFPFIGRSLDDALQQRPAMEMLLEATRDWPVPMWNLWLPAFIRLAEMGREAGCEVILTGGGGDEWLGVGPHLAADLLRTLQFGKFAKFTRYMHQSYSMPYSLVLSDLVWKFGLKQLISGARNHVMPMLGHDLDASRARRALPDWLAPDPAVRRLIVDRLTQARRTERLARNAAPSLYAFEARRSLRHPIVVSEIENKFAMSEAAGVHFFEPYWDADLIELLYRTPPDILSRGGIAKGLVHKLVRDALPAFKVPKQVKLALNDFYLKRVRTEAEAVWRSYGGVRALEGLGLVDGAKFSALVERILHEENSKELWMIPHVLSVESWLRAR